MKQWFTRNITKPFIKKFGNSQVFSGMENMTRTFCGCNCGVFFPVAVVMMFTLLILSINTIRSNNNIVFSIGSPGREPVFVNGIYKTAYERNDGSIDVVFNIPKGAEALVRANISGMGIDPKIFNISLYQMHMTSTTDPTVNAGELHKKRNLYPLTLDVDYVINPAHLCPVGEIMDYIIIVHSATAYFDRRRVMRETFAAKKLFGSVKQRILFLLGETNDPRTTRAINQEALVHGDILQGPFTDSYHNLTHKGVMGLRWVSEFCPNTRLVVKMDDDVFMNPFQFIKDYLPWFSQRSRTIICHVRPSGTSAIERGKGKWQVGPDEFRGHTHFPFVYCNGFFVILTPDIILPMLLSVKMNPFFWIDDVYLYGMLPATIGNVIFHNIKYNLTMSFSQAKKCYSEKKSNCTIMAASQWRENEKTTLWQMVLNLISKEEKESVGLFQFPTHKSITGKT